MKKIEVGDFFLIGVRLDHLPGAGFYLCTYSSEMSKPYCPETAPSYFIEALMLNDDKPIKDRKADLKFHLSHENKIFSYSYIDAPKKWQKNPLIYIIDVSDDKDEIIGNNLEHFL